MSRKSWHLKRRTFLQGCGLSLGLPLLDCMADSVSSEPPKRFCGIYFPYGIVNQQVGAAGSQWNWFPSETGREFQFGKTLRSLESLRDDVSVLGGLSHPNGRKMGGHDTADIWLTGAELKGGDLKNSVSVDQLIAGRFGDQTRYSSLVISTDGGVGEPTRSSTLSFSDRGQPIPAENRPQLVFDRLFGIESSSKVSRRHRLENSSSMLDGLLDHSKTLRNRVGKRDQVKLDEYLESVRQIEQRVIRSQRWLEIPKPQVESDGLHLEADDSTPRELISTMYDLIFLAFQTDSTRVATYQLGNMNGATSIAGKFPQILGYGKAMHALAHGARKGEKGAEELGQWAQFLADQLGGFLNRLQSTPEGDVSLLDRTCVLYGSSNSHTHVNQNYPLLLAGGGDLGIKHGQHLRFADSIPMSNLLVTVLNRLDVPTEQFVDSTGEISELV